MKKYNLKSELKARGNKSSYSVLSFGDCDEEIKL